MMNKRKIWLSNYLKMRLRDSGKRQIDIANRYGISKAHISELFCCKRKFSIVSAEQIGGEIGMSAVAIMAAQWWTTADCNIYNLQEAMNVIKSLES